MRRAFLPLLVPAVLALPAASIYVGGWATITVDELPEQLVAGRPVELSFMVRQHGVSPLGKLRPRVEARSGKLEAAVAAVPGAGEGRYRAALTVPEAGSWTITIHSGFGRGRTKLLPIRAVAAGTRVAAAAVPDYERGHALFLAKGCADCHVHRAVDDEPEAAVGPELTARRFQAEYLARFLADPSIGASTPNPNSDMKMPDPGLKPAEITALVAFLNGGARQAAR